MSEYFSDMLRDDVLAMYDQRESHYHTARHACEVMDGLEMAFELGGYLFDGTGRRIAMTAALFHDVIYVPGAKDNESRSAQVADAMMRRRGWTNDQLLCLNVLINSTSPFTFTDYAKAFPQWSSLIFALHDLDWIGFRDYDIMVDNETRILDEAVDLCPEKPSKADCVKAQKAFYERVMELSSDPNSVIGGGFYRLAPYAGDSQAALDNIDRRVKLF